jgi:hypothetical protein
MSTRNYITHTVSGVASSAPNLGDEFFDPATNTLTKVVAVGGTVATTVQIPTTTGNANIATGTISAAGNIVTAGTVSTAGNIVTTANIVYNYYGNAAPAIFQSFNTFGNSLDTTFT